MAYKKFSEQEIKRAAETDIVDMLRRQGEELKAVGSEYEWKHGADRITIRGCQWYNHYEERGGNAIKFVQEFFGKNFKEAMEYLLGGTAGELKTSKPKPVEKPKQKTDFQPPERNESMRRVYAYLLTKRGLDKDVVSAFVKQGLIYESADYHNAVFVGEDKNGKIMHASLRATGDKSSFRGNAENSVPEYSFHWYGKSDTNEKYIGDVLVNKTYIEDCISKRVKVNNGEREKFYIENHHPAIIDRQTFARVQEELARRKSKPKVWQQSTKTQLGRYSSKYALTELLICGKCKTPYRRCTWTHHGKKKVVWRCVNRMEYGKKYCPDAPTIEEVLLHEAIMSAVQKTAMKNTGVLKNLKEHLLQGLSVDDMEDNSLDIQIRIREIDERFQSMLNAVSSETVDAFDSEYVAELMQERNNLQQQLARIVEQKQKRKSRG